MNAADWPQYHYRAVLVRVKDGDTAVLDVDLGFDVHAHISARMMGYNAPELHGPNPLSAQAAAVKLLSLLTGQQLYVRTERDSMTFERYVAQVFTADKSGALTDIKDLMNINVPQGQ